LHNNVDDELEEIKRLIADSPSPAPTAKKLVPARPRQAVSSMPKKDANNGSGSAGTPAASKKPEQTQISAPTQQSGNSPMPVKKRPMPPAQTGKPMQPAQGRKPAPPIANEKVEAHSYDISQSGKISTPTDTGKVRDFDISPNGKVSKHREQPEPELDTGDDDFEVNFDFDGEYQDVPEEKPLRLRRERRTGCIGGILYAAFIICISLVFASILWLFAVDVLGFGSEDEDVNITIPPGFEMSEVTDLLYDAGLIRHRFLFNAYANFSNAEERITAGQFILNKSFDYRALVQGMTARAGVRVERRVTIPEGFTMMQIFNLLADYGIVHSADDLWEAATNHNFNFHFLDEETIGDRLRLEGFLFPETYNFFVASSPVVVINRFLREFDRRFTDEFVARAAEMNMSIHDIINVAAMIEREAANDEERPRVAAVIYNRLNNTRDFPFLQIDATLDYAVQGTDIPATTNLDHPFNTYTNPGLPPGPIANPGIASIRAALYPLETNEYFYALHVDGTHRFFRTYDEHRAFVRSELFGRWW